MDKLLDGCVCEFKAMCLLLPNRETKRRFQLAKRPVFQTRLSLETGKQTSLAERIILELAGAAAEPCVWTQANRTCFHLEDAETFDCKFEAAGFQKVTVGFCGCQLFLSHGTEQLFSLACTSTGKGGKQSLPGRHRWSLFDRMRREYSVLNKATDDRIEYAFWCCFISITSATFQKFHCSPNTS